MGGLVGLRPGLLRQVVPKRAVLDAGSSSPVRHEGRFTDTPPGLAMALPRHASNRGRLLRQGLSPCRWALSPFRARAQAGEAVTREAESAMFLSGAGRPKASCLFVNPGGGRSDHNRTRWTRTLFNRKFIMANIGTFTAERRLHRHASHPDAQCQVEAGCQRGENESAPDFRGGRLRHRRRVEDQRSRAALRVRIPRRSFVPGDGLCPPDRERGRHADLIWSRSKPARQPDGRPSCHAARRGRDVLIAAPHAQGFGGCPMPRCPGPASFW